MNKNGNGNGRGRTMINDDPLQATEEIFDLDMADNHRRLGVLRIKKREASSAHDEFARSCAESLSYLVGEITERLKVVTSIQQLLLQVCETSTVVSVPRFNDAADQARM